MTNRSFEEDLAKVLSDKASWRAPTNLRLRVAAVPDENMPSRRLWRLAKGVPRVARFAALILVLVLAAGSVWFRYDSGSPASGGGPLSGGDLLTIETEVAPTPLPSGVVWACPLPESSLSLRVERAGSGLVFRSTRTGDPVSVVWPFGFSARVVDGRAELMAPDGTVAAREGDVLTGVYGLTSGNGAVGGPAGALHVIEFNGNCYLPSGVKVKVG
jgi:hypothetical protein